MKFFIYVFLICSCILCIRAKVEKYVRIALDAKWKQTPLAMEASEYISQKSNDKFWRYISSFKDMDEIKTAQDEYKTVLEKSALVLSPIEMNTLKFALSLRYYSPRVQLFQQIASGSSMTCEMFYQIYDTSFCNFEDFFENLKHVESKNSEVVHDFDHVFPGSDSNDVLVTVFADFTSTKFQEFHAKLSSKVNELNIKYVYRPFFKLAAESSKIMLSGYGVELAVKGTEYKAVDDQKVEDKKKNEKRSDNEDSDDELEGFLFKRLQELHPTLKDDLGQYKQHLKESNKELAPLKVWQLQDLSFQAAQRIKSASSQDVLNVLKDISQNAPMVARSLVKTKVDEDLRKEVAENQKEFEVMGVAPGAPAMFINGIEISVDELNAFKLLTIVNGETGTMSQIGDLNLDMSQVGRLLALNVKPSEDHYVLDIRSESVQWLNNLEKDPQYNYWPSNLNEILRPTFPGMMRYIAKNIFHIVGFVDPLSPSFAKLLSNFNELIENSVPARFGLVFVADGSVKDTAKDNVGAAIVRAFSFIKSDKSSNDAFRFLTKLYQKAKNNVPNSEEVIALFESMYGKSETEDVFGEDSDYDDLRRLSHQKYVSLGLKSMPYVLVNGEAVSEDQIADNLENALVEKILTQTQPIQQAVYMGSYQMYPSIFEYVMSQPNVASRINPLIQSVNGKFMSFGTYDSVADVTLYTMKQANSYLLYEAKYFISDKGVSTVFIVANADTEDGRTLLKNALKYVLVQKDIRLAVFLHGDQSDASLLTHNTVVQIILGLREKLISGVAKFLLKFLQSDVAITDLLKSNEEINKMAAGITGVNKKKLFDLLKSSDHINKANALINKYEVLVKKAFGAQVRDNLVVVNGRVIGPLKTVDIFVKEDFELLQNFENGRAGYKINEVVNKMKLQDIPSEGHDRYKSDLVLKIGIILSELNSDDKRTVFTYKEDKHSVIHLPAQSADIASLDVDVILDPLSKGAQKLASILPVIYESFNVNLKIFLNPKPKHSEIPVNRFYQYVIQSELNFNKDGSLMADQAAIFTSLPHSALLTLIMDTPQSWLIEAVGSNHDLDNINLGEATGDVVYGDFELENIIVQGSCNDISTQQHPRGLQFVLGTEAEPDMFDTIVMANLGYFQLKAFPGSFVLQLREGRSSQIYQIDSLEGGSVLNAGQNYTVVIDDFTGKFLKVKVKRLPGKEKDDLLGGDGQDDSDSDLFGIWDSIASYVKTKEKSSKNTDGKIHIFSVATGLLYERFLRIMMLSVLKHTKTPVKFWFLKNYLSAGLTSFLPRFAEKYGFEYELVQYQWPKWLNGQTEKQRIIWGYKILFLDVLFPLNLERIIFVDADQIVRADLKELMDMDLDGAPYAYTPFCNDRPEVEGFRFWNHGYWRNHLAGRPYHISALYVVDLKRFRRVAAGDRLRGQYQGLSQDPNSLSNLDQDLPNNMIHQVQIKSLPQEWLWCETWCSDESKSKAKTIDMCNNPQTKEPKLQRAMRIAPEWIEYDVIIKDLMENTANSTQTKQETSTRKTDEL